MVAHYVFDLGDRACPRRIGTKGEQLQFLMENGFKTPTTCVCTWDAYLRYLAGDPDVGALVEEELSAKLDPTRAYAVRSSANVEDTCGHPFAGQFKTILNVCARMRS